ncbi:MAG: hypothetical protein EON53_11815 [Actinomycetales bacterium]|nr:MAG: hypothetical protein EON53_11815 [Actinomycetales bacterium]
MTSASRTVRGFASQWLVLALAALAFVGVRRVIEVDESVNWVLFGQIVLFTTLACVLGAIYRRPLRQDTRPPGGET